MGSQWVPWHGGLDRRIGLQRRRHRGHRKGQQPLHCAPGGRTGVGYRGRAVPGRAQLPVKTVKTHGTNGPTSLTIFVEMDVIPSHTSAYRNHSKSMFIATAVTGGQNAIESHKGYKGPFLQKTRDCLEFVTQVVTSGRKMRYAAQWPHLKQKWLNLTVA